MAGPVVTISASYGTAGARIGHAVADRLGVPFLDRVIPVAVAESLAVPIEEAIAHDERRESLTERFISALARAGGPLGTPPVDMQTVQDEETFRRQTELVIRDFAATGGVILGRAGTLVLAQHPTVLRVRLDGPVEGRVRQAVAEGIDEETARHQLESTDGARAAYIRHFYRTDLQDPALYHVALDATALPSETCVELIVTAARARMA